MDKKENGPKYMRTAHIGFDPGKDGFITVFIDNGFHFFAMPTHKVETGEVLKSGKMKTKTEFHEEGLLRLVVEIKQLVSGAKVKACIEQVGGRGGWSATNNFNFGYTAGLQKFMMMLLRAEITMVRPQKWQSAVRQGYQSIKKPSSTGRTMIDDPKAIAEMIVNTEYPNIDFRKTERSKVNHDGKIDSFLICLFSIRSNP